MDGSQVIHAASVCDGNSADPDCPDGSDEGDVCKGAGAGLVAGATGAVAAYVVVGA